MKKKYFFFILIFTFLAQPNFSYHNQPLTHSLSLSFFIPLFILSLGAIFFGDLSTGIFNTLNISIHPIHFIEKNNLIFHLASNLTLIPLFFFILLIISPKFIKYNLFIRIFPSVLTNINLIWSSLIITIFNYSNVLLRYIDRGLLEIVTPYGLNVLFHYIAFRLELLSTGYLNHLLLPLILFITILLI